MTTHNYYAALSNTLAWAELHAATFDFNQPFCLNLTDNHIFVAEKVVRIMPKKRMVVFGRWRDKQVVAKLFFDPKHAKRHIDKEIIGFRLLKDNRIPSANLYDQMMTADKRVHVLLFERIVDAENLDEVWQTKNSIDEIMPLLQSVIVEIATQHVFGLTQQDLHFKNFLINEKTVFTLDGAQIQIFPKRLPPKQSMSNLALFLSQLGANTDSYQEKLFRYYAKSRGWSLKPRDIAMLFEMIRHYNEQRWKKFSKKIFRNSTDYLRVRDNKALRIVNRHYQSPELLEFFYHPDAIFQDPRAEMIKAGRSATVIKIMLDQRHYVIKRYNLKNIWHKLRRCLRTTRAAHSWRLAHKFSLFAVSTAIPVCFIEQRFLGLRGKSYYVTEYVDGEHVGNYFADYAQQEDKLSTMIKRIVTLFRSAAKVDVSHGDLKMTNILIDKKERPVLIDLDGAKEHTSFSRLRKEWRKEIARFLNNFQSPSPIREQFELELKDKL